MPQEYSQIWETKRKKREVKIFFENNKISKLILHPKENTEARIQLFKFTKLYGSANLFFKYFNK